MRHLVRDISRVLTLFLASRQAWPKILGGVRCLGGNFPQKGAWIKHCLMVTNSSGERSFSKLKRIKIQERPTVKLTMRQCRLNRLTLMSLEHEMLREMRSNLQS